MGLCLQYKRREEAVNGGTDGYTGCLYLADGTSVNTISTANTKLAISKNTACNGCRWK